MGRVAGYLTRFDLRRVSPSTDYTGVGRGVARDFLDQTEVTFTMLIDGAASDMTALGQGRVVLHDGSCDADRLGGLERERDEWRRKYEAVAKELEATRKKMSARAESRRVNGPWRPAIGERVQLRREERVGVVVGVRETAADVRFDSGYGGFMVVTAAISELEPVTDGRYTTVVRVNGEVVLGVKEVRYSTKPASRREAQDARFAALDLDDPEEG